MSEPAESEPAESEPAEPEHIESPDESLPAVGPGPSLVDWDFALSMARRLGGSGPRVSAQEASDIVGDLHETARLAHGPVAETSRLVSPPGSAPVLVVDRPGWV